MKKIPVLRTARLTLRGISEEDTQAIVSLRSEPNVYKFFISPHQITVEEHLAWYKNNYLFNEDRLDWIALDTNNNLVGIFGVKKVTKGSKEVAVSYILNPAQYGKGYASEAVNRLIQFCRDEWKCVYVVAEVHEENTGSIRFAEKLGFTVKKKDGRFFIFGKECR